jgi:hypothetical protein
VTDHLRRNGNLTELLGGALRDGAHGLSSVPGLLKQVLAEESWREFVTQRGERVEHDRFADFCTTPPLKGLGTDVDLIRRIVADDPEAEKALRDALKGKPGPSSHNNIIQTKQGTSRAYALDRLERDAPELHAEVLAGNLSAHRAMVRAGFRPKTFTVRADDAASAARTLRKHMTPEQLAELARLLVEGA